jgi:transposase
MPIWNRYCLNHTITAKLEGLGYRIAPFSTVFCGSSRPEHPGVICRNATGIGTPSTYMRFKNWRRDGTWTRIFSTLLDEYDDQGHLDHDLWCIDGTIARAARCAGGARRRNVRRPRMNEGLATEVEEPEDHALGYARGGFSTKVHVVCDSHGTVLGIHVTPGQRHESKAFEPTLQRLHLRQRRGRRKWPRQLAGDKGYSYPRIWRWLQRRRITKVIPTRKDQTPDPKFNKETYRKRNIIERVVGWAKESRRLLTRFEKLAVNYLAFWVIASFIPLLGP